jgi:hypothetical protein
MHFRWIAREDGNVITTRDETVNKRLADESATTCHDDLHPLIVLPKESPA